MPAPPASPVVSRSTNSMRPRRASRPAAQAAATLHGRKASATESSVPIAGRYRARRRGSDGPPSAIRHQGCQPHRRTAPGCLESSCNAVRVVRPAQTGTGEAGLTISAQAIGERAHAGNSGTARAASRSRMRSATALARGPVLPIGPTHVGQPCWHWQPAMRSRIRRRSSTSMENSGSLKPMPPGIVVVDEDARLVGQRDRFARPRQVWIVAFSAAPDRDADVLPVAHQQQLSHLAHRKRQTHDAVPPVIGRERKRRHHRSGTVSQ